MTPPTASSTPSSSSETARACTLSEEAVFGGEFPIGQELQSRLAGASAHDRARFTKLVETVFADQRLTRIRYEHDSKGRKVSVTKQMGSLGEDRTTFVYDDHDNVIEECEETRSHAANVNEQGEIVTIEEPATRQCNRLEYQYRLARQLDGADRLDLYR